MHKCDFCQKDSQCSGVQRSECLVRDCLYFKPERTSSDEAICAVRDYMVQELLGGLRCIKGTTGGYDWTLKDGRTVELRVTIKE